MHSHPFISDVSDNTVQMRRLSDERRHVGGGERGVVAIVGEVGAAAVVHAHAGLVLDVLVDTCRRRMNESIIQKMNLRFKCISSIGFANKWVSSCELGWTSESSQRSVKLMRM